MFPQVLPHMQTARAGPVAVVLAGKLYVLGGEASCLQRGGRQAKGPQEASPNRIVGNDPI